jgi:hypothetical protein
MAIPMVSKKPNMEANMNLKNCFIRWGFVAKLVSN